jgi:hypothetical protein
MRLDVNSKLLTIQTSVTNFGASTKKKKVNFFLKMLQKPWPNFNSHLYGQDFLVNLFSSSSLGSYIWEIATKQKEKHNHFYVHPLLPNANYR